MLMGMVFHLEHSPVLILKKEPTLLEEARMMNMPGMLKMVRLMRETFQEF